MIWRFIPALTATSPPWVASAAFPNVEIHPDLKKEQRKRPTAALSQHPSAQHLKVAPVSFRFTFSLTKDWWVLAYFAPLSGLGITGCATSFNRFWRRRPQTFAAPALNSLVSWSRIADSLFLHRIFRAAARLSGQNPAHATASGRHHLQPVRQRLPLVMALANGVYILHPQPAARLPRSAVIGNFFRSIPSIPQLPFCSTIAWPGRCTWPWFPGLRKACRNGRR